MKSMLQELDSNLTSTDNFIHEQNCKLAEKDNTIWSNKAEIERLEKKNKMQEHKVKDTLIDTCQRLICCRCAGQFFNVPCGSLSD